MTRSVRLILSRREESQVSVGRKPTVLRYDSMVASDFYAILTKNELKDCGCGKYSAPPKASVSHSVPCVYNRRAFVIMCRIASCITTYNVLQRVYPTSVLHCVHIYMQCQPSSLCHCKK